MRLNRLVLWRARSTILGVAVALVALLALSLSLRRPAPGTVDLKRGAAEAGFTPLCLRLTRGTLETNELTQAVRYLHRYYRLQHDVRPVSLGRYRFQNRLQSLASRLGVGRLVEVVTMDGAPRESDTVVLWVGYRSTNSILSRGLVLAPDGGTPRRLTPVSVLAITAGRKHLHLDCFELPAPLTRAGMYRLVQPEGNRPLLSFRYE